jgi:ribosomal protein S18 acetylase RimI-like enzyme
MRAAFASEPIDQVMFPHGHSAEVNAAWLERHRRSMAKPGVEWSVARDGADGQIIGCSKWVYYATPRSDDQVKAEMEPTPDLGEGVNREVFDEFFTKLADARFNTMRGKPHAFLHLLDVSPSHQRRGAGSRLLDRGIAKAEEMGLPCYLEASGAGLGLYKSRGFEEVGVIEVDLTRWGKAMSRHTVMVRPVGAGK